MAGGPVQAVSATGAPQPDAFQTALQGHGFLPFFSPDRNVAAERELLMELRGFEESLLRLGFEDVDLSWRAQLPGRRVSFAADAIASMTLSSGAHSFRRRFLLGQGRVLIARRYPEYDSSTSNLVTCTQDVARTLLNFLRSFRDADHGAPRGVAPQFIASLDLFYGHMRPSPRALSGAAPGN